MTDEKNYTGIDNLEVMKEARNYNHYLLGLIRPYLSKGGKNIDFGAGVGTFAIPFCNEGFHISCVETDTDLKQKLGSLGVNVVGDLKSLDEECYDVIYTLNVLEHIEDDVNTLKIANEKLKNEAVLLIYVPAFMTLFTSMDKKVGHFRRYTGSELRGKLIEAGFVVESVRYVDCLGYLAALLFKYVGNESGDINKSALIIYDKLIFPISVMLDTFMGRFFGKNVFVVAKKST